MAYTIVLLQLIGLVAFGKLLHQATRPAVTAAATTGTPLLLEESTSDHALAVLYYACPITLIVLYVICVGAEGVVYANKGDTSGGPAAQQLGPGGKPLPPKNPARNTSKKDVLDFNRPRKLLFKWLSVLATLTWGANAVFIIIHALLAREEQWWCGKPVVVYLCATSVAYLVLTIAIFDTKPSPTLTHAVCWVAAALFEIAILGASLAKYTTYHREPTVGDPEGGKLESDITGWEAIQVSVGIIRLLLVLAQAGFYAIFKYLQYRDEKRNEASANGHAEQEETTGLLQTETGAANGATNGAPNGYGTADRTNKPPKKDNTPAGWEKPTSTPSRTWWEYVRGYSVFFPYLWPSKDRRLQINVVICIGIMILQRVVQVAVPYQTGVITDKLATSSIIPWGGIFLFVGFRLMQGNNGILGAMRAMIWLPVQQYSFRELSTASFEHVHTLSLDFHLGKKTGEVLSALGKGAAINNFLESVTFQVLPMLVDLVIAAFYFYILYSVYFFLVIAIVTFWYIYITIRMARWRQDIRRVMVNADREVDAVKQDSMVSYETVKYFNAEAYEYNRHREAIKAYQRAEYHVIFSLNIMNVTQNLVFMIGLMISCFIAAYMVVSGQMPVGKFVTLITYMAQLQGPLNFFGTFYRMIQSSMINSERMLELFKEKPTVEDDPDASAMPTCEGDILFNDVRFAYDARKPALSGLNFHCKPGTTTALVGESGGGKSTVFRLLFRFYQAESGTIQVDGNDVQDVTIDSLRKHIGVVPQDTVLFNESLMYNLKYANQEATDEQVYEACRAASIHDKILAFPDGYQTKVGERGLRLSGGEKQRVAIARTILKNPRIILLDEATAALDTDTEEHIQEALLTLAQGRTMLVIAHRLSTITMADQILVLHEGRVDEKGTHDELLNMKARYSSMWKKQVRAQRAAEEAQVLKDKAERLRRASRDGSAGLAPVEEGEHSGGSSEDEKDKAFEARKRASSRAASSVNVQAAKAAVEGTENASTSTK